MISSSGERVFVGECVSAVRVMCGVENILSVLWGGMV